MCLNVLFLRLQVQPTKEQYELDTFGRSHDIMSNFWNSCFDDLMSTAFKRDKDRSDSKSKFQVPNAFEPNFCNSKYLVKCSSNFPDNWSGIFDCLCWNRRWLRTRTWRKLKVRTTGTTAGRSRAPTSRGWCWSTGNPSAGFWPVREERGPTGMKSSL